MPGSTAERGTPSGPDAARADLPDHGDARWPRPRPEASLPEGSDRLRANPQCLPAADTHWRNRLRDHIPSAPSVGPVTHLGVKAVSPTSQNSRVRRDPKDPFSSGTAYPESTGQSSTTEGQVTQPHRLSCPGVTCDVSIETQLARDSLPVR